jgi:hypothetical protein
MTFSLVVMAMGQQERVLTVGRGLDAIVPNGDGHWRWITAIPPPSSIAMDHSDLQCDSDKKISTVRGSTILVYFRVAVIMDAKEVSYRAAWGQLRKPQENSTECRGHSTWRRVLGDHMGSTARTVAAFLSVILAFIAEGYSQEWTSFSNELLISRHFSEIVISGRDATEARIFIDPIRNVSNNEAQRLRQLVVSSLSDKVRIVNSKDHANYWVQILFQNHKYPIKNPNNETALGSVLFSTCKYPTREVTRDCENLTYFYFFDLARIDLFERVFALSMNSVFPSTAK